MPIKIDSLGICWFRRQTWHVTPWAMNLRVASNMGSDGGNEGDKRMRLLKQKNNHGNTSFMGK